MKLLRGDCATAKIEEADLNFPRSLSALKFGLSLRPSLFLSIGDGSLGSEKESHFWKKSRRIEWARERERDGENGGKKSFRGKLRRNS